MDATEAQLKFGASLTNSLDLTSPGYPLNTGSNSGGKFIIFQNWSLNFKIINNFSYGFIKHTFIYFDNNGKFYKMLMFCTMLNI